MAINDRPRVRYGSRLHILPAKTGQTADTICLWATHAPKSVPNRGAYNADARYAIASISRDYGCNRYHTCSGCRIHIAAGVCGANAARGRPNPRPRSGRRHGRRCRRLHSTHRASIQRRQPILYVARCGRVRRRNRGSNNDGSRRHERRIPRHALRRADRRRQRSRCGCRHPLGRIWGDHKPVRRVVPRRQASFPRRSPGPGPRGAA
ncbi:MAG: hypothetical protein BWY92_01990 [Firmicutes bacterium ADurb.BinA052]|nr:MAG: hypothetical protein BWY92_01990 [Firmicutes bacterium ADurb.BinA052]